MSKTPILRISSLLEGAEKYHFARPYLVQSSGRKRHGHDFCELFWIEAGKGVHWINGECQILERGHLFFVNPTDIHELKVAQSGSLRIVNIAFLKSAWTSVYKRCFSKQINLFEGDHANRLHHISEFERLILDREAEKLTQSERPAILLESFLMTFGYFFYNREQHTHSAVILPEWLHFACTEIEKPEHFRGGTLSFSQLSGRSPEHVAREVKKLFGKTPTDLVNEARMRYSAQALENTSKEIIDIAFDCGFSNLSHFYTLFRKHFGASPRAYRLRSQRVIGG